MVGGGMSAGAGSKFHCEVCNVSGLKPILFNDGQTFLS